MTEWKSIIGYENEYLVSNNGDVFSLRSKKTPETVDKRKRIYARLPSKKRDEVDDFTNGNTVKLPRERKDGAD